jgi:multidrug transporter EmrE-like cation transporter
MINFILILIGVLLNAFAQIFLKKGMTVIGNVSLESALKIFPQLFRNIYIWEGMACYGLSVFLWLIVLSRVQVSYAYPFLSIGYVVTAFIGYYYLGETITTYKIMGIGVICFGIVILSRG